MESEDQILSSDKALDKVGGYNLFQILAFIIVVFSFSSGGQIAYALPYLQSKQIKMDCTYYNQTQAICSPTTACNKNITSSYSYIHDKDKSLQNWVVTFELGCESEGTISWLSTFFFAGFLLGSGIFLALADKVGRKPITLIGLLVHVALNISINYVTSYPFLIVYVILFGIRVPMASHVPYMILMELVSPRYRSQFSLMVNGFDGFANIFIALGFKYLQNWKAWFLINDIEVGLIFILILVFLPESPRYLISTGQFQKARKVFAYVAQVNKKPMFPQKLEGEGDGLLLSPSQKSSSDFLTSPLSNSSSAPR